MLLFLCISRLENELSFLTLDFDRERFKEVDTLE